MEDINRNGAGPKRSVLCRLACLAWGKIYFADDRTEEGKLL